MLLSCIPLSAKQIDADIPADFASGKMDGDNILGDRIAYRRNGNSGQSSAFRSFGRRTCRVAADALLEEKRHSL